MTTKQLRKIKAKRETARRNNRINSIAADILRILPNDIRYKVVTGETSNQFKSLFKRLYNLV